MSNVLTWDVSSRPLSHPATWSEKPIFADGRCSVGRTQGRAALGSNLPSPRLLCCSSSGWSNPDTQWMGLLASARHRHVKSCEPASNKTKVKAFSLIIWQRQKRPTGKIWWENKQSYKLYFFLLLLFLSYHWQMYQLEFCCFGNVGGISFATNHLAFR